MTMLAENLCREIKSNFRFFQYLDDSERVVVGRYLECCEVPAGTVLWQEGDESDAAAFVVEGKIEVKKATEFEDKHVIVGIYAEGSVVGELCLFSGDNRAETATALTNARLLKINDKNFEALLKEHPVIGGKLLKGMFLAVARRLRKSFERLAAVF
ncbi:Crp/Fnr family transcriptional regulator [Geopsychrobacter electrodiphilus]|uniref:Crp/Fnr family transcriptional regulator n=1 Tax=Geopsychrobacter electrodiphilus TaxID=225196 RepID=UPI000363AF59|nr:cyclic nucleotide-binding domain-containing protein [Geopsychrobacter electrodiphilus]